MIWVFVASLIMILIALKFLVGGESWSRTIHRGDEMTEIPDDFTDKLTQKRETALAECPKGFEFVGWVYDEVIYHYALYTDAAFPVYRKTNNGK